MEISSSTQQFLQIFEIVTSKFDTLLFLLTLIAAIFGSIITIALAFFVIRQLNVDREIRRYADEIRKKRDDYFIFIKTSKSEIEKLHDDAKEKLKKVPLSKEKLKELEKELEGIKEQIAFNKGVSTAYLSDINLFNPSSIATGTTGTITATSIGKSMGYDIKILDSGTNPNDALIVDTKKQKKDKNL